MTNPALLDRAIKAKLGSPSVRHIAQLMRGGAADAEINCPTSATARRVIVAEYQRLESLAWPELVERMRQVSDDLKIIA